MKRLVLITIIVLLVSGCANLSGQVANSTDAQVDNAPVLTLKAHNLEIEDLTFSSDGQWLATVGQSQVINKSTKQQNAVGEIKLWQVKSWQPQVIRTSDIGVVAFSNTGRLLAGGTYDFMDSSVKVWDVSDRKLLKKVTLNQNIIGGISSIAFNSKDSICVVGDMGGVISFYDTKSWKLLSSFKESAKIDSLSFSKSNALVAGLNNHAVVVYEGSTAKKMMILQKSYGSTSDGKTSVSFSPDGKYIATGTNDNQPVKLWDAKTQKVLFSFNHPQTSCLVFSSDSKKLATGSWDSAVVLWDVVSGKALKRFHGHTAQIYSVSFHPQGKILASGGRDGTVKIWNADR